MGIRRYPRNSKRRSRYSRTVTTPIVRLARTGEGIGSIELDDHPRAVFVPHTVPGDVVRTKIRDETARVLRGDLLEVLTPSSDRIEPPCPFSVRCGGCDFMHLSPQAQLQAKRSFVLDALQKAHVAYPPPQTHDATSRLHYRIRARLAARAKDGEVTVGFRRPSSHVIVPVKTCLVLTDSLNTALEKLEDWLCGSHGHGEVHLSQGINGLPVVSVDWTGQLASSVFAKAERLTRERIWAGVQLRLDGATKPATIGQTDTVTTSSDGTPLHSPAAAFVQAHDAMNALLVDLVVRHVRAQGQSIIELFAGSGNFSVRLALEASSLVTVEAHEQAVTYAHKNLTVRGLNAKLLTGDATQVPIPTKARVAVLDPPREGNAKLAARMAESRLRQIVMVSCNPSTAARDVHVLCKQGGFSVTDLHVVDMFPQTSHVETVLVLER